MDQLTFQIEESTQDTADEVRERISTFLAQRDFEKESGATPTFRRGSKWGTWFSLSGPKPWETILDVQLQEREGRTQVRISTTVNAAGQIVTDAEKSVLEEEHEGLKRVIHGEPPPDFEDSESEVQSVVRRGLLTMVLFATGGSVLFGALSLGLVGVTDMFGGMVGAGAGFGAGVGFAYVAMRERA